MPPKKRRHKDEAKQAAEKQEEPEKEQTFEFKVSQTFLPDNITKIGLMVDYGATSHILTEEKDFTKFDESFPKSQSHTTWSWWMEPG